ncbi:MAG TPA: patatin-like phospholipase family protein [Conexibacter sp.]|nr:patatin-like phospholipase family protein [Conexibacter sp.]
MTVGLVLSGGAARGAYEIGALSALLPHLEAAQQEPRVLVGTSIGAINAALLASFAELDAGGLALAGASTWLIELAHRRLIEPLVPGATQRLAEYRRFVCNEEDESLLWNLLDRTPMGELLETFIPLRQIATNIGHGRLDAVAVVATSALTGRPVVFHQSAHNPDPDATRRIDYVATQLRTEHLLASSALPGIFPAVQVTQPGEAAGWYWDGATRLNTPIKPALALGAERVVVIGLDSLAPGPRQIAGPVRPDAFSGLSQLLHGVVVDTLERDLAMLTTINEAVAAGFSSRQLVPYIFIAPQDPGLIGNLAQQAFARLYPDAGSALRSDAGLIDRAINGQHDRFHGELLSLLMFDEWFIRELIEHGRRDAQMWIATHHSHGLWETGPLRGVSAADWNVVHQPPPH